eukprot:4437976-Amphidinium_carterae.1
MLGEAEIRLQGDVRCRRNHMIRLKCRGQKEAASQPRHVYDDSQPWRWVCKAAVDDVRFWDYEIIQPCLMVVPRGLSPSAMVDGYAPVVDRSIHAATDSQLKRGRGSKKKVPDQVQLNARKGITRSLWNRGRVHPPYRTTCAQGITRGSPVFLGRLLARGGRRTTGLRADGHDRMKGASLERA